MRFDQRHHLLNRKLRSRGCQIFAHDLMASLAANHWRHGFVAHFAFFAFAHRAMTAARAWSLVRALRFPLAFPPLAPIAAAAALRGIGFPQWGQFIGCGSF